MRVLWSNGHKEYPVQGAFVMLEWRSYALGWVFFVLWETLLDKDICGLFIIMVILEILKYKT